MSMLFLKKWGPLIGVALLAVVILTVTYCNGKSAGRSGEVARQLERETETLRDVGTANENAAATRVDDLTKAERQNEELNDALETTDDPDRQRALRGCIVLRQQGVDTANVSSCR